MEQITFEHYLKKIGATKVLTKEDVPSLNAATARILALMKDGQWYPASEILRVSGQREGLRRMRELREYYTIERRRSNKGREFEYRLII